MKQNIIGNDFIFENVVAEIFEYCGYRVKKEQTINDRRIDLVAEFNNYKYFIEVKYLRIKMSDTGKRMHLINTINQSAKIDEKWICVVSNIVSSGFKNEVREQFNIEILDLRNLLYMIKDNLELYNKLLSIIEFSTNGIIVEKPNIYLKEERINDNKIENILLNKFNEIKPGKDDYLKYQDLCIDTLKYLFINNLSIWKKQENSNDNLYRFDLICKIKSTKEDDFFGMLIQFFNTKYIIFEFKNYKEQITQNEIYTTEKYLYDKALRRVAIIISRKGFDNNAIKASKGCLRENGKLIINLSDECLIKMIKMKNIGNNPIEYLSKMLDTFLIELEK